MEICEIVGITIDQFADDTVTNYVQQVYEERDLGGLVSTCWRYDTLEEAYRVAVATQKFDGRHREFMIFRTKSGKFAIEKDVCFMADLASLGHVIVATVSVFGCLCRVEVAK